MSSIKHESEARGADQDKDQTYRLTTALKRVNLKSTETLNEPWLQYKCLRCSCLKVWDSSVCRSYVHYSGKQLWQSYKTNTGGTWPRPRQHQYRLVWDMPCYKTLDQSLRPQLAGMLADNWTGSVASWCSVLWTSWSYNELKNINFLRRILFQQRGCSAGLCVSQS